GYLRTKQVRFGHLQPAGEGLVTAPAAPVDIGNLLGSLPVHSTRPAVVVKFAQTLDGRIATATGDSKWISGEPERRAAHAMRAARDAVLLRAHTLLHDHPRLTGRVVPPAPPLPGGLASALR